MPFITNPPEELHLHPTGGAIALMEAINARVKATPKQSPMPGSAKKTPKSSGRHEPWHPPGLLVAFQSPESRSANGTEGHHGWHSPIDVSAADPHTICVVGPGRKMMPCFFVFQGL